MQDVCSLCLKISLFISGFSQTHHWPIISINSINFYNIKIYIMKLFFTINVKLQILCLIVDEIYRNYWSKIDLTKPRNRLIFGKEGVNFYELMSMRDGQEYVCNVFVTLVKNDFVRKEVFL
jgi:hypothetical protein